MLVLMAASYIEVSMKIWIRVRYATHVGIRRGDAYQEEGACQGDVIFPSNTTSETFVHEQNECEIDTVAQRRT